MLVKPHDYGCTCEHCAGMVAAILACNSAEYFFSDQELAQIALTGEKMERANELVLGEHKCKFHDYEHYYVRHVCGHEYCAHTWKSCPRCYGSHLENQVNPTND